MVDATFAYAQVMEDRVGGALDARYVRGAQPIRLRLPDGRGWWYLHDALGSTRAFAQVATTSAEVTDWWDYEAFGAIESSSATSDGGAKHRWVFAGEERRAEVGLDYLRARWMTSSTGRFASRDRLEATRHQPTRAHRYLYAGASPVFNSDATGYDFSGMLSVGMPAGLGGSHFLSKHIFSSEPMLPARATLTVVPIVVTSSNGNHWSMHAIKRELRVAAEFRQRGAGITIISDAPITNVRTPHGGLFISADEKDFSAVLQDPRLALSTWRPYRIPIVLVIQKIRVGHISTARPNTRP